jgi:hypothetical protein
MRNSLRALTDWKRSSVRRNEQLVAQPALAADGAVAPPLNRQVVGRCERRGHTTEDRHD